MTHRDSNALHAGWALYPIAYHIVSQSNLGGQNISGFSHIVCNSTTNAECSGKYIYEV